MSDTSPCMPKTVHHASGALARAHKSAQNVRACERRAICVPYTVPVATRAPCRTSFFHVHVHVQSPSRQDAQPPVPWRHNVEGANRQNTREHRQTQVGRGVPAARGSEGVAVGGRVHPITTPARANVWRFGSCNSTAPHGSVIEDRMYAPCVYLSSISCVNRLPPVSSLDSPRSHGPVTSAGLQAATRR